MQSIDDRFDLSDAGEDFGGGWDLVSELTERRLRATRPTRPIPFTTVKEDFAELEATLRASRPTKDITGGRNSARFQAVTKVMEVA